MEGLISGSRMRMMWEMVEKRTEKKPWSCEGWERVNGLWLTGDSMRKGEKWLPCTSMHLLPVQEETSASCYSHILIFTGVAETLIWLQ